MARSAVGWVKLLIFYIIFYGCLASFFAALMVVFNTTVNVGGSPRYFGSGSLLQDNPGIGMRPITSIDSSVIRLKRGDTATSSLYKTQLDLYIDYIERMQDISFTERSECPDAKSYNGSISACFQNIRAHLDELNCGANYGFDRSSNYACFLLKVNKLYGYEPDVYLDEDDLLQATRAQLDLPRAPKFLALSEKVIGINCAGNTEFDTALIDTVTFSPQGFPAHGFPYMNQLGYVSPYVAVRIDLKELAHGVGVQINCKLWARNIDNRGSRKARHGTLLFEMIFE